MDSERQQRRSWLVLFSFCSSALQSKHLKSFGKSNIERASFLLDVDLGKIHDLNARQNNYINNSASKPQERKKFSDLDQFHKWNLYPPATHGHPNGFGRSPLNTKENVGQINFIENRNFFCGFSLKASEFSLSGIISSWYILLNMNVCIIVSEYYKNDGVPCCYKKLINEVLLKYIYINKFFYSKHFIY